MAVTTECRREWSYRAGVALLLTAQAVGLWSSTRYHYVTIDEVGHIAAGLSHWQTGSFCAYRVNPPLPRMLATLPVWASDPVTDYTRFPDDGPGARPEWPLGRAFSEANAPCYFDLVLRGRLTGIAWTLVGGWLVARWARELYGRRGGLLALTVWAFEPNILAFGPLMFPDVPAAVAGLTATYVFWRHLRRPSWGTAAVAGVLLGLAQLTKMTLLVLYAVWPLMALIYLPRVRRGTLPGQARLACSQGLLIVGLSLLVLNAGYGFRDVSRKLGDFQFVSKSFAGTHDGSAGNRFAAGFARELPVPLPADYLLGMDTQRHDFETCRYSFLAGEWRDGGWWEYYLYAMAVKVPLGFLALILAGVALAASGHRCCPDARAEAALLLPAAAVLLLVSSQTGFNRHMRYVLPAFPFLITGAGKAAYFLHRDRWWAGVGVVSATVAGVASSLSVYPHFLSYFNEAAGGPDNGHRHLLCSNIDWGQDVLQLKHWLDQHPEAAPLHLALYHVIDPAIEGINNYRLPPRGPRPGLSRAGQEQCGPQPGWFAVSVNFVGGSAFKAPDGEGWFASILFRDYEYFQHFRPVAKAGYSIFIYRITPEEANRARAEMGLPPLPGRI